MNKREYRRALARIKLVANTTIKEHNKVYGDHDVSLTDEVEILRTGIELVAGLSHRFLHPQQSEEK